MKINPWLLYLGPLAIVLLSVQTPFQVLWPHFVFENIVLHSSVEAIGAIIALALAAALLRSEEERFYWPALGLLAGGLLDLFHAAILPGHGFVLLHSTSILAGGFWFALVWLPNRKIPRPLTISLPWIIVLGSIAFGIYAPLLRETLPAMRINNEFTPAASALNGLGGAFFLLAAARFLADFISAKRSEDYLFFLLALAFGLSGLLFKFSALWDDAWWFMHFLRLSAYILVLALMVSGLFQKLAGQRALAVQRRQAEEDYRTIILTSLDGFWMTDASGRLLAANDAYCRLIGYSRDELLRMNVTDIEAAEKPEETAAHIKKIIETGSDRFETRHRGKDGGIIDLEVSVNYLPGGAGRFCVFLRDITERKRNEKKIMRLDALLHSIRDVNQLIVIEKDADKLLNNICGILARTRDYRHVWIGEIAEGNFDVLPKAKAGLDESYFEAARFTWDDSPTGRGPVGTAIKTRRPAVVHDVINDPSYEPWREQARQHGCVSAIAVPISINNNIWGSLNICSPNAAAFDDEEINLLLEVASDLGHALRAIETEAGRRQAEEQLQVRVKELEEFNKLVVGRELKMVELEKEVNSLLKELGREPKYNA
ncbi:hypothetical protein A3D23_06870 [candidate division WOR-1 bacterium RIFCSPHIGHO2_02_FULL_53_26]|nr:MAG: hypothetical protein A3D23_06870 [candidate division WOR-1 bacterium RIFCSPHIGHO2_02_FULL_53_26]